MRDHITSTACASRLDVEVRPLARPRPVAVRVEPSRERTSSISRAFGWTFLGRMVYGACQWGILSVLAKLGGTSAVGRFALALAITAPVCVLASMQLRSIYATDVRDEFSWSTYWRLRLVLSLASFGLVLLALPLSASLRDDALTIALVAASKAVEMVEDLLYGVFQRFRAMHRFGRSLVLRGLGSVLAVAATQAAGLPLEASVGAMLGVWIAVLSLYDWPHAMRLRGAARAAPRPSGRGGRLLWLALPMGLVMLLDSLNQNVPRYLIEQTGGLSELGIYVAMAYVIPIGGTVVFALGAPLATAMARDYAELRRASFTRHAVALLVVTAGFGAAGVAFAWLAGEPFLRLVYSEQFVAPDVFVWVMVGAALHYVVLTCNNVLTATRRLRIQSILWGVTLAATTTTAWALVPVRGALGAAQAFALGVAVGAILSLVAVAGVVRELRRGEQGA